MEGIGRRRCPNQKELMKELGRRLGVAAFTAAERYREIMRLVQDLAPKLETFVQVGEDDLDGRGRRLLLKGGRGLGKKHIVLYVQDIARNWKKLLGNNDAASSDQALQPLEELEDGANWEDAQDTQDEAAWPPDDQDQGAGDLGNAAQAPIEGGVQQRWKRVAGPEAWSRGRPTAYVRPRPSTALTEPLTIAERYGRKLDELRDDELFQDGEMDGYILSAEEAHIRRTLLEKMGVISDDQ